MKIMVHYTWWVASGTLMCLFVLWWYFRIQKNRINKDHQQHCKVLEQAIDLHQHQISKRHHVLNRYDFLTHNLEEALLVQPEIK